MQERDDRSIGELVAELSRETTTLVRQELQLAIIAAVVIVLGSVIPLWLSALAVGAAIALVGLVLVVKGANTLRQEDPAPRETIETLKEDKEWLRDQTG